MSQTSKIITAIIASAVIIALAIVFTNQDNTVDQVKDISNKQTTEETVPNKDASVPETQPEQKKPAQQLPEVELVKSFEEIIPTGNWLVNRVTLDNKTVNLNVNVSAPLTLQFNTKTKKVTGFAGCNSFSGSYVSGLGVKLSFENLVLGKKACGPSSPENTIIQAMNNVTRAGMKGNQLVLSNEDSSTELVYDQAK